MVEGVLTWLSGLHWVGWRLCVTSCHGRLWPSSSACSRRWNSDTLYGKEDYSLDNVAWDQEVFWWECFLIFHLEHDSQFGYTIVSLKSVYEWSTFQACWKRGCSFTLQLAYSKLSNLSLWLARLDNRIIGQTITHYRAASFWSSSPNGTATFCE